MTVLVAGWFSLAAGGATAGDLLVRDVVCGWLRERGMDFEVAQPPVFGPGVDWFRVAPERYGELVFVCGPVGPDLPVAELIERFASCRRIAVDVSLVGPRSWHPFDVVLERDGRRTARPDLSLAATPGSAPVVARVQIHRQAEYAGAAPELAHAAFDRLLASRPAAVIEVDTRLDPTVPGRRSPDEVAALLRRADLMLTTRLHGLVLALGLGVPVVAVDPIAGGAKVLAQARVLGWPAATSTDAIDDAQLSEWFHWCLGDEARGQAAECAARGRRAIAEIEVALERALHGRRLARPPRRRTPA